MSLILSASLLASIILNSPTTQNRLVANKPIRLFSRNEPLLLHYFWATNKQVDYVKSSGLRRFHVLCSVLGRGEFTLVNGLERNIIPFDSPIKGWHYSPNGRYLLYFDASNSGSRRVLYNLSATSPTLQEYPDPHLVSEPQIVWFPDSKHWAEFGSDFTVRIRSVADNTEKTVTINGLVKPLKAIGIAKDGTLVLYNESAELKHINLNAHVMVAKAFRLPLSSPYITNHLVDFPRKQDRLLWTTVVEQRPNAPLLFPIPKTKILRKEDLQEWVAYYTTRMDGSHPIAIGTYLLYRGGPGGDGIFEWDMIQGRWLPDDKSFSFYYNNELYRYALR